LQQNRSIKSIDDLRIGDHVCFVFDSDDQYRAVIAPFIAQGLERGEKVQYVCNEGFPKEMNDCLEREEISLRLSIQNGRNWKC